MENENGSVYRFHYDPVGRLLQEQGFDGKTTEYRYDEATGVLAETVEAGVTTRLDFDPMGRLVQRRAAAPGQPEQIETFAYNANGQLADAKNEHARLQWFYDTAGNLVREHQHYQGPFHRDRRTAVWHHRYDELNQRIGTTRPDGHRVDWLTYGAGHVHGLLLDGQDVASFERDALHRETGRTQANGLLQTMNYDPLGRLVEQQLGAIARVNRYTVETYQGARKIHTHQVITDEARNTMIIDERKYNAMGDVPVARKVEVELPDAAAAQKYQRSVEEKDGGIYDEATNSCMTHVGNVLRAGGIEVPEDPRSQAKHFKNLGFQLRLRRT